MKAYIKFKGSSIHGFGEVKRTDKNDTTIYAYAFINESGTILFDNVTDRQVEGIQIVADLTQQILHENFK